MKCVHCSKRIPLETACYCPWCGKPQRPKSMKVYPNGEFACGGGVFIRTGERRPPKKGEWYISGAIPKAYKAPNDLTHNHVIAVKWEG